MVRKSFNTINFNYVLGAFSLKNVLDLFVSHSYLHQKILILDILIHWDLFLF